MPTEARGVHVRLGSVLSVHAGRPDCHIEAATLKQALEVLTDLYDEGFALSLGAAVVLVNGRRVDGSSFAHVPLRPGDTIELIPMIAGG